VKKKTEKKPPKEALPEVPKPEAPQEAPKETPEPTTPEG
jgi:hypothetical protein